MFGQFGQLVACPHDPIGVYYQRHKIRIGKIAVIVRFFLAAHGAGSSTGGIEQPCFLDNRAAIFNQVDLTPYLVFNGLLDKFEGVDIFYFGAGAQFFRSDFHDRYIGVAAETALFHVAVADVKPGHDPVELFKIDDRLVG